MNNNDRWTTEQLDRLLELHRAGKTAMQIAVDLGVGIYRVQNKLARLRGFGASGVPATPKEIPPDPMIEAAKAVPIEYGKVPLDLFDGDGWTRIGLLGDTHLCCRESRLDALGAQYALYEREGIRSVFHAGNIVDGYVARINGGSVLNTTIDGQAQYVIDHYPRHSGVTTYFITGDDHEGWWQKEGFNFGAYLQMLAEKQGRNDLRYIGHVEADVEFKCGEHSQVLKIQHPGGGSAYARSYKGQKMVECVSLNTEILTRRGWKKHDEIFVGEEVLGYNIETDRCEWTPLLAVNRGEGELVEFSNDQFSAVCTPHHKWAQEVEQRAGPNPNSLNPLAYSRRYRELAPLGHTNRRARIIQAAVAPGGAGLQTFSHRDYLNRAGTVANVLQMTGGERRAFIEGMLVGEGNRSGNYGSIVFSQNAGPVLDGFRLACFLECFSTTERASEGGSFSPEVTHFRRCTLLQKRMRLCGPRYLPPIPLGNHPIWCPTTRLGTWVMRQDGTISITGNSFQGGEKPCILAQGHYHVSGYSFDRNVHIVGLPGFQDQTIFGRKKHLRFEVGGCIAEFKMSSVTGTVTRFRTEFNMFFDRSFYKPFLTSDVKNCDNHVVLEAGK